MQPVLNKTYHYKFEKLDVYFSGKNKRNGKNCIRDVNIMFLGKIRDLFVFDVFIAKVTFESNQSIANERLLKKDIYAFGSIMLGTNDKGEIIKIYNLDEIQKRWEDTKTELRQDYIGYEFEIFLEDITNVLATEEKIIYFLKTPTMYGLFFHGLFGKNDHYEVPIKRKNILLDFDYAEITEEIWTDNRGPEFILSAKNNNDKNGNEIKNYQGKLRYDNEAVLKTGYLEIEDANSKITYSVELVG